MNGLSYLNPISDNFLLRIAFIPNDNYFSDYGQRWQDMLSNKFGVFFQIRDTLNAVTTALSNPVTNDFNIEIDLSKYGIGKVEIVNGIALNTYGEKIRFWIGGLIIFFTVAFLWRKGSDVLGSGK